jgi:deoxyadenosine/deoxycytidine kinase
MTQPKIFSIEGNIGSGKTTIIENLQKRFANNKNVVFIREPVDIWQTIKGADGESILAKFYKDPSKYAFAFQIMAYSTRLSLLRETIRNNPLCEIIITERSLDADKNIFAKMLRDDGLIDDISYQIYQRFYEEFQDEYKLDGIVYIDADAEICKERVLKRSREGENSVCLEYLKSCQLYHERWLSDQTLSTKVLKIKTNENVTYDVNEPGDKGVIWMDQIMEFISWINHVNINSEMITEEIYGRRLNNYEEFYNPNL